MKKIQANHYTDTIIYALDLTLRNIKVNINQYITTILPDITPEQFFVLDTIYAQKTPCQQDVSKALIKDKSNVKRIVEILEENNYIVRKMGKRNNRLVNYLEVTELGKKTVEENMNKVKAHMMDMFSCITDEEVQTLKTIVEKLNRK